MPTLEDLHTLIRLLNEFQFPVSPVLKFAIKEKEEELTGHEVLDSVAEEIVPLVKKKSIEEYGQDFANLSVGRSTGKKSPHKIILLLAIFRLIADRDLKSNEIPLEDFIAVAFSDTWHKYFVDLRVPSVWIPYWYMKTEPFWHFVSTGNDEILNALLSFAGHPSVGQMRPVIKCAKLDDTLFEYLQTKENRDFLANILVKTYLS